MSPWAHLPLIGCASTAILWQLPKRCTIEMHSKGETILKSLSHWPNTVRSALRYAVCSSPKIPQMVTSRQKIPRTSFNYPGQFHPERPFGLVSGHRPTKSSSRSHSHTNNSSSSSTIHTHIILWTYFPDSCPVSALLPTTSTTQPPAEGETGAVNQRDIDLSGKGIGG